MHICCSNCCIYPLQILLSKGIETKGLWFNPNIHPYTEYSSRLNSLKKLQSIWKFDMEYIDEYPLDEFLKAVTGRAEKRCEACYFIRLDRTAEVAKKLCCNAFTTSLLASPYQKFDMIINIGKEAGKRHGVEFWAEDLRQGWNISRDLSREFELYRQKYCGCIYSEMERFIKKK